ncbi:MAG: class I SAM-dependent methyltransferase [Desulfurobacteriaceae bacterium]
MIKEIKQTIEFYNQYAEKLIEKYEKAEPKKLQTFILKSLPGRESKILEIGFGSGRELKFLMENGYQVWGVDGAIEFVKLAKKRFPEISNRFFHACLPDLNLPSNYLKFFDVIISIAVLMHIPKRFYRQIAKNLAKYLKDDGVVILSYSLTPREERERFFERMDPKDVLEAFLAEGFRKEDELKTSDAFLERRDILWITEVYRLERKD